MPQRLLFILLLLTPYLLHGIIPYQVVFQGDINESTREILLCNSQLKLLEDDPPLTIVALRRRAEADIPNLVYALHSVAYFNAKVDFIIDETRNPARVLVNIETGPIYPLLSYNIELSSTLHKDIFLEDLDITLGCPAYTKTILEGEEKLLALLAEQGYPLATIEKRKVVADQEQKGILVTLIVNPGLQVVFGKTRIFGLKNVVPSVVTQRVAWLQDSPYDPQCITQTEFELESLGLFNSISIVENENEIEDNQLPIDIFLREANHRTIGFGVSYNTQLGPGGTFNWENRNMRGLGERFKIRCDIWQRKQTGILEYIVPDFYTRYQQLRWLIEADKEITEGFDEFYCSASGLIDWRVNPKLRVSYGGSFKQLYSSKSDNNRAYSLFKTPLLYRWVDVDQPFNPTFGYTANIRCIPTISASPFFGYSINLATLTGYYPLFDDDTFVFAMKAHLGSIYGSRRHTIPPPERLYAGSECILRGYKYMTVSPLDRENKPIGGRSIMVYSLESRFRVYENFGGAFFYEVGNVYEQVFPQFFHKQLQSIGFGLRYYTQVGPLRLDVAFPLNPRKGIDKPFQLYISIGQAF